MSLHLGAVLLLLQSSRLIYRGRGAAGVALPSQLCGEGEEEEGVAGWES